MNIEVFQRLDHLQTKQNTKPQNKLTFRSEIHKEMWNLKLQNSREMSLTCGTYLKEKNKINTLELKHKIKKKTQRKILTATQVRNEKSTK